MNVFFLMASGQLHNIDSVPVVWLVFLQLSISTVLMHDLYMDRWGKLNDIIFFNIAFTMPNQILQILLNSSLSTDL
ncbi:hypothetical protein ACJX0J_030677, partial [Zea mays]